MKFLRNLLDKQAKLFEKGGKLEKFYPAFEAFDAFLYTTGKVTQGPSHVRDALDLKRMMTGVIIALAPCIFMAMYNTGFQANLALTGDLDPSGWRAEIVQSLGLGFSPDNVLSCLVYGALFFIQAGIPLEWSSEPVLAVGPEDEDEQSADPVWQQARNQVFNPAAQANQSRSSRRDTEALMRKLIDGLKHAANIRYMAPEERVVVTVLSGSELPVVYGMAGGGASGMGGYYRETYGTGTGFAGGGDMGMYGESGGDSYGASRTPEGYGAGRSSGFSASPRPKASQAGPKSTLTLLVGKGQIDAFAQGQMKLNDFIKCVQVIKY